MLPLSPTSTLFPYTTLFRSGLIERYVKPALGDRFLADLRPLDVQAFYAGLSDRKLSPRTVRYTHSVLTSAFKQAVRSEEHTSELQSRFDLVCRLLLEKKNNG